MTWYFGGKAETASLTGSNLTETGSGILTITGGTGAVLGTGTTIQVKKATALQDGYLSKTDFTTFSTGSTPITLGASAVTAGLSLNVQELNARKATTAVDGYLCRADWATFNAKEPAVSKGNLTSGTASAITIGGTGTGALIGGGASIAINKASASADGYLGKDNWSTFNGKQNALTFGNLVENASSILTISGGTSAIVGNSNCEIQVKKATDSVDGYQSRDDHALLHAAIHADGYLYVKNVKVVEIRQPAMTGQLTSLTYSEPGTPDYAIQTPALDGYGFVTPDEGLSVLKVVANLQVRVAELEARLKSHGLIA